jgi:hypothetical protein
VAELGRELGKLRLWMGKPSFRVLETRSREAGTRLPRATASDAEQGRHLPRLEIVEAFVWACGVQAEEEVERWRMAWRKAAANREFGTQEELPTPAGPTPERRASSRHRAAKVLAEMPGVRAAVLLAGMPDHRAARIVAGMGAGPATTRVLPLIAADRAARALTLMPADDARRLLAQVPDAQAVAIRAGMAPDPTAAE